MAKKTNKVGFQKGHPTYKGVEKGWFEKGQKPWNANKEGCFSKETIEKMSLAKKGKPSWNKGLKGYLAREESPHWNGGGLEARDKRCPECTNLIMRKSTYCRECSQKEERSYNWQGGLTLVDKRLRQSNKYKKWRSLVFERDNYTCLFCGIKGGKLEADHIRAFSLYPKLRFDINNGRTLCVECHKTTPNHGYKARLAKEVVQYGAV